MKGARAGSERSTSGRRVRWTLRDAAIAQALRGALENGTGSGIDESLRDFIARRKAEMPDAAY